MTSALQSGFVTISLRGVLLLTACQKLCFEVAMWSRQIACQSPTAAVTMR
jgi:hypothetical protein